MRSQNWVHGLAHVPEFPGHMGCARTRIPRVHELLPRRAWFCWPKWRHQAENFERQNFGTGFRQKFFEARRPPGPLESSAQHQDTSAKILVNSLQKHNPVSMIRGGAGDRKFRKPLAGSGGRIFYWKTNKNFSLFLVRIGKTGMATPGQQ